MKSCDFFERMLLTFGIFCAIATIVESAPYGQDDYGFAADEGVKCEKDQFWCTSKQKCMSSLVSQFRECGDEIEKPTAKPAKSNDQCLSGTFFCLRLERCLDHLSPVEFEFCNNLDKKLSEKGNEIGKENSIGIENLIGKENPFRIENLIGKENPFGLENLMGKENPIGQLDPILQGELMIEKLNKYISLISQKMYSEIKSWTENAKFPIKEDSLYKQPKY